MTFGYMGNIVARFVIIGHVIQRIYCPNFNSYSHLRACPTHVGITCMHATGCYILEKAYVQQVIGGIHIKANHQHLARMVKFLGRVMEREKALYMLNNSNRIGIYGSKAHISLKNNYLYLFCDNLRS